jgi:hypothetical protein
MNELWDSDSLGEVAKLQGFLPYLESAITKLETTLENQVFAAIDKGQLTPDQALLYWQQKLTYRRLLRHFSQRVNVAQTVSHRVASTLGV